MIVGTATERTEAAQPRDPHPSARAMVAQVEVAGVSGPSLDAWRDLEDVAPASPYQTSRFLLPWLATEGAARGVDPFIVIVRDRAGRPIALLPLGIRQGRGMRVASFLGGKHVNYGMGLFRPGLTWSRAQVTNLLRTAAEAAPRAPDLYTLANQPFEWRGAPNPLAALPHQASPSPSHRTDLPPDPDAFFALYQSGRTRKLLRNKRARLEAIGSVRHIVARSTDEVGRVLTAYLTQKAATLAGAGIGHALDQPSVRAFLSRIAAPSNDSSALELHALFCGDRIVATFGGLAHQGRFSGLLISYAGDADIVRTSPGELLLTSVIRSKCAAGFSSFDLGIGEARYKDAYCPTPDPLFDSFLPVSTRGRLWAAGEAGRLRAKGWVKQSPAIWATAQRLRKVMGAVSRKR